MRTPLLAALLLALAAWIPATGAVAGPAPPDLDRYLRGQRIFVSQCIFCHGRNGRGDGEWAGPVATKPRDFTKGIFKFRTTPMGTLPTEADLVRTLRTGVSGTMMPSFSKLSESELLSVISYVRGFSDRWDDPRAYADAMPLPEPPAWLTNEARTVDHARRGAAVFSEICATCHGPSAKGDGPAAKGLIDAWGHPISPADLTTPGHKSGERPIDLYRTISMGLDGTPMIGFLAALGPEKIWDLVAFIRSREQAPRDAK